MNPLALDLNEQLSKSNPEVADMLSDLGKLMYYPKGILSQSAEAKSTQYNATIGMATYKDSKMYANTLTKNIKRKPRFRCERHDKTNPY